MATVVSHVIAPSGGDYTSLSAWESAQKRNLVSADEIAEARMRTFSGGLNDSSAFNSGWTTDATRFIRIIADTDHRHTAQPGTGAYFNTASGGGTFRPVTVAGAVHVEGIGITGASGRTTHANGGTLRLDGIYAWGVPTGDVLTATRAQNCMVFDCADDAFFFVAEAYFCSALSCGRGFVANSSTIRNCISGDSTTADFANLGGTTLSHSISEDATSTGTGAQTGVDPATLFTDAATGHMTLTNGATVADAAGIAVSGITLDWKGTTRTDPPDIGADQVAAVAAAVAPHIVTMWW